MLFFPVWILLFPFPDLKVKKNTLPPPPRSPRAPSQRKPRLLSPRPPFFLRFSSLHQVIERGEDTAVSSFPLQSPAPTFSHYTSVSKGQRHSFFFPSRSSRDRVVFPPPPNGILSRFPFSFCTPPPRAAGGQNERLLLPFPGNFPPLPPFFFEFRPSIPSQRPVVSFSLCLDPPPSREGGIPPQCARPTVLLRRIALSVRRFFFLPPNRRTVRALQSTLNLWVVQLPSLFGTMRLRQTRAPSSGANPTRYVFSLQWLWPRPFKALSFE